MWLATLANSQSELEGIGPALAVALVPDSTFSDGVAGASRRWYRLALERPGRLTIDLDIDRPGVDLDLYVFGASVEALDPFGSRPLTELKAIDQSRRDRTWRNEHLVAGLSAGVYFLVVSSASIADSSSYTLRISLQPQLLFTAAVPETAITLRLGQPLPGVVDYDNLPRDQWYRLILEQGQQVTIALSSAVPEVDLNLLLYLARVPDMPLAVAQGPGGREQLSLYLAAGSYLLLVRAARTGNAAAYQVLVSAGS
ncbi:MAG: hypothetical protein HY335_02890 [Deinococcus sp.]|nr:hypothetical protein [Deinococcus sp.]